MKFLITLLLIASLVMLPQNSPAPIPVYLGIALKCVAMGTIGTTAVILYNCEPDYYLVRYKMDGEDTYWACSQASTRTLAKTGGARCEGPVKKRAEMDFRAYCNNQSPDSPMFPCGYAGQPLPNATWTNYSILSLDYSVNGGGRHKQAHVLLEPGEPNWSVVLLGPTGTAGMTRVELLQLAEADLVVTNALPAPHEIKDFTVNGFVTEVPISIERVRSKKRTD